MFDVAPSELLLVAIVALIAIGPKDLPLALRTLGRWMGKMRRMSNHFRAGVDAMIREAELAEIEKEWQERNQRIMAEHPDAEDLDQGPEMEPLKGSGGPATTEQADDVVNEDAARAEARNPELPLPPPPRNEG